MMINFAMLDHALDFWLMELFPAAVKSNEASKMPYELGHKIELLRKCFDRLPAYGSHKEEALELLAVAEANNKIRNTVAHGAISHYEPHPEPAMLFSRIRYDKVAGVHLLQEENLSLSLLLAVNSQTADLIASMHRVANALHGNR